MTMLSRALGAALAVPLALAIGGSALAQDYPSKPISMIVTWNAGGSTDVIARLVAPELAERLGQPVAVANTPGGGGSLGTQAALDAPKDGHTILATTSGNHILTPLKNDVGYRYDDFEPIGQLVAANGFFQLLPDRHQRIERGHRLLEDHRDVTPAQALGGVQLICGMNATRLQLNNAMRAAAGLGGSWLPTGPAEKIICLKNQNGLGLINGMFVTLDDIVDEGSLYFSAVVTDEEGRRVGPPDSDGRPGRLRLYKGHFEDHIAFDRQRHDRDWKEKKLLTEATFGWAITAHKAQGSQWENVIVWDDGLGRTETDRRRWLYTAITRAERGLVLLA